MGPCLIDCPAEKMGAESPPGEFRHQAEIGKLDVRALAPVQFAEAGRRASGV